MNNLERSAYGRDAMAAGTPDFKQNDLRTNAVDTIANVLHALHAELGSLDGVLDCQRSALTHFLDELEPEHESE